MYGTIFYGNTIFGNIPGTILFPEIPPCPVIPTVANYKKVGRFADMCSCGAIIISGCSPDTFINNRQAAIMGCRTSHNSIMMICSALCMVNNRKLVLMMDMNTGCTYPRHPPTPLVTGSPNTYAK